MTRLLYSERMKNSHERPVARGTASRERFLANPGSSVPAGLRHRRRWGEGGVSLSERRRQRRTDILGCGYHGDG